MIWFIVVINIIFLGVELKDSLGSIEYRHAPNSVNDIVPLGKGYTEGPYLTISSFECDVGIYSLIKDQYYVPKTDKLAHRYNIVLIKDKSYIVEINESNDLDEIRFNYLEIKEDKVRHEVKSED